MIEVKKNVKISSDRWKPCFFSFHVNWIQLGRTCAVGVGHFSIPFNVTGTLIDCEHNEHPLLISRTNFFVIWPVLLPAAMPTTAENILLKKKRTDYSNGKWTIATTPSAGGWSSGRYPFKVCHYHQYESWYWAKVLKSRANEHCNMQNFGNSGCCCNTALPERRMTKLLLRSTNNIKEMEAKRSTIATEYEYTHTPTHIYIYSYTKIKRK